MSTSAPLRVGLLLDSLVVPAWVAALLRDIQNDPCADIVFMVMHDHGTSARQPPERRGLAGKVSNLLSGRTQVGRYLYQAYSDWDERRVTLPNDPNAAVDMTAELANVTRISVVPITDRFIHRFQDADLAQVRNENIDVLLRFGFNIIKGPILQAARYGMWSFHHGDNQNFRGGPPYFWELFFDRPLSGIVLQVLGEKLDAGRILYRSYASTERGISKKRNGASSFWKGSSFVIRRLRQLHKHGWQWMQDELPTFKEDPKLQGPIFRLPTNGKMVRFVSSQLWRNARRRANRGGKIEQWIVAYRSRTNGGSYRELPWPKDHYYADPFLIERQGRTFLFFEDYLYNAKRGIISHVELFDNGSVSETEVALDLPYHLSYPFLFEHEGDVYMIPESASNRTVQLYRAAEFPNKWELVKVLRDDIKAYDVTLLVRDGVYWFFASVVERGTASCDELFLYHANSLTGEWTSHPMNPIVSDVRRARPAGNIYEQDGKLIRPSQDCSLSYGGAIQLNEIVTLSRTHYEERPVDRIEPDWMPNLAGTHTVNHSERFEVLDGRRLMAASAVRS